MVMWYRPADNLFCQRSIHLNMDVQYRRCTYGNGEPLIFSRYGAYLLYHRLLFWFVDVSFRLYFPNASRYSKRKEILLYSVSFCPPKSIISSFFACSIFSGFVVPWENTICCFLISFAYQAEFFLWYLIFLHFVYSTWNKPCLETRSCVCGYWAYGLFIWFRTLWNISKEMPGN